MNMLALLALVRKDLKEFATDRRAMIMGFVAPILLASFMATVLGGISLGDSEAARVAIRVADEDRSDVSRGVLKALEEDKALETLPGTAAQAREAVRTGKAVAAVVIPAGFGEQAPGAMFGSGEKPTLGLLYDPTHQTELAMVRGVVTQHVMQVVGAAMMRLDSNSAAVGDADIDASTSMSPELKASLKSMFREIRRVQSEVKTTAPAGRAPGLGVPFETSVQPVTAGNMKQREATYSHAFGGMAVQFILFTSVEMGVALLTERQRGVWKRLRAAPLSRLILLAARVCSGSIIALAVTCVVFGFGALVFGIRIQGGPAGILGFLAVSAAYALAASMFGLLIAALGKTPQAARGVAILVVLVMVMLGGAWMPSQFFPAWVRRATPIIPTRWAMDGFDAATIRANTIWEMLGPAAALLGFAAVFGLLAVSRFRWEAEQG